MHWHALLLWTSDYGHERPAASVPEHGPELVLPIPEPEPPPCLQADLLQHTDINERALRQWLESVLAINVQCANPEVLYARTYLHCTLQVVHMSSSLHASLSMSLGLCREMLRMRLCFHMRLLVSNRLSLCTSIITLS